MKEIGMQYDAIHGFLDDHVIYYNRHEFATKCTKCHISRYQTDQITKKGVSQGSSLYYHYSTFTTTAQVQKHSAIYGLPCKK